MKAFRLISKLGLSVIIGFAALTGCSDDVDESNLYSFTGDVVTSFLEKDANFSNYCSLLKRVKLSTKSSSTLYELLSTRGNYTVFAPTNEAVRVYVDSMMGQTNYPLENLSDSIVSLICKNSIVDSDDHDAYMTSDFEEGALSYTNMNDRYVTVNFDTLDSKVSFIINSSSRIINGDNEVSNGVVHVMGNVVSSSMAALPTLMATIPNVRIFTRLLDETGWTNKMQKYIDQDYEDNHPETGKPTWNYESNIHTPDHRKYGYTAFVETDDVFAEKWGINLEVSESGNIENWDEVKKIIEEKCSEMSIYAKASAENGSPESWTDANNVVNQFVAYHLMDQSRTYNLLVIHMNELGFSYKNTSKLTLNVDENYVTMGDHRRILRITEGKTTEGKRINRCSTYDGDTYDELTVMNPGLLISSENIGSDGIRYTSNALNGFYYPISDILEYSEYVRDNVLNTRMRWDFTSYTQEAATNSFLNPQVGVNMSIPNNYLSNFVKVSDETWIVAKNEMGAGGPQSWRDYMTNEYQVLGIYDITMLIPPAPYDGTYEIRMGFSNNPYRAMAQVYFGDDPDNLPAIGTPIDMRLGTNQIGWLEDDAEDPTVGIQNDKDLRNKGYMKAPNIVGLLSANGASETFRSIGSSTQYKNSAIRKILWNGSLQAGKKYYLRFKSVLSYDNAQLFTDYMEIVPKSVYGGTTAEDKW